MSDETLYQLTNPTHREKLVRGERTLEEAVLDAVRIRVWEGGTIEEIREWQKEHVKLTTRLLELLAAKGVIDQHEVAAVLGPRWEVVEGEEDTGQGTSQGNHIEVCDACDGKGWECDPVAPSGAADCRHCGGTGSL